MILKDITSDIPWFRIARCIHDNIHCLIVKSVTFFSPLLCPGVRDARRCARRLGGAGKKGKKDDGVVMANMMESMLFGLNGYFAARSGDSGGLRDFCRWFFGTLNTWRLDGLRWPGSPFCSSPSTMKRLF